MAVTINEIARLANVSRATVDKVIHKRPGVKEETRERIQAILENVDYHPNPIGKALVLSKNPIKIGVIPTPEYNPFIQVLLQGIKKAQKEFSPFGFEVIVKMPTTLEPAELISILLEFENLNVAGIALIPIDNPQVIKKLNDMQDNGIKILTFNSPLESIRGFCYVGQNHVKAGSVAAGLMEKLLPQGGKVGIIISSKTLSCHPDRLSGFQTRLHESSNGIEIVEVCENQDKRDEAFKIALSYLNKYPDLQGFYLSGSGSDGVKNALAVSGVTRPIKIISHDLVPETEVLLKDQVIDFVISQNASEQGYQIVRQLFDYLIKMQPPKKYWYEIPIQIISREVIL
ncbi:MAG: LacI family DNA-binding transcriptional regulator [Eubacteriales bacterium]|nr:LacI family DNA-binding transcriptional regulator [Eubacteriales bacterium]